MTRLLVIALGCTSVAYLAAALAARWDHALILSAIGSALSLWFLLARRS